MKQLAGLTAGALALVAAFSGAAVADGMPRRVAAAPPPPPPVVQDRCAGPWTGFYIGGNIGWAHLDGEFKDHDKFYSDRNRFSDDDDGFTAGGQLGYNLQCGSVVFGVETDINWVDLGNGNHRNGHDYDGFRHGRSTDWFGTTRGRIGWTNDRIMIFATGGVAYTDIGHDFNGWGRDGYGNSAGWAEHRGSTGSDFGWVAGGGVEWLHSPNWTIKAEALWIDFDSDSRKDRLSFDKGPCYGYCYTYQRYYDKDKRFSNDDSMWVARIGINYKFGDRTPVYEPLK